jgi:hypothetical protein
LARRGANSLYNGEETIMITKRIFTNWILGFALVATGFVAQAADKPCSSVMETMSR